jgi:hypothetical protein
MPPFGTLAPFETGYRGGRPGTGSAAMVPLKANWQRIGEFGDYSSSIALKYFIYRYNPIVNQWNRWGLP